jgi:peroxiredoxin
MQQVVDLQDDPGYQALGVPVVSIAFDSLDEQAPEAQALGITSVPMLSDTDHAVSQAYDVLQWAIASGEPGHTFVLVDAAGRIAWIQDYGAPDNPNRTMYVPLAELTKKVGEAVGE